jgi:hypothetical protein
VEIPVKRSLRLTWLQNPTIMKKTLFITLALLLSSCAASDLTHIAANEFWTGIDFRPYAEKGFLFTLYKYNGLYTTIGMFNFVTMPEANKITSANSSGEITDSWWVQNRINSDAALQTVYEKCIEMGADAFVDFTIQENSQLYPTAPAVNVTGFKISGVAIRRDD